MLKTIIQNFKGFKFLFAVVGLLGATVAASPANALELVQETNPANNAPKVPASDIIFDEDFNARTSSFTYQLGSKYKAYNETLTINGDVQDANCSSAERPNGRCEIEEKDIFGVYYTPEAGELVRGEEKTVPGRIIKIKYTDVAQDIDGHRLDFEVELSNLKITPMPNLPATSTVQPPEQEWSLFFITEDGRMEAAALKGSKGDARDLQEYIDCYRDTSCPGGRASGMAVRNDYMITYDISFNFYKTGTTEVTDHAITLGFTDIDIVRVGPNVLTWNTSLGTPIVREGVQLKTGTADNKVYTIDPIVPSEGNNGFRLRTTENNTLLEAPCYHYDGNTRIVADGDQTSNCKQWLNEDNYNAGFAAILPGGNSTFAWSGGSNLGTFLFQVFGSMLSIEKTASQSKVKAGDTFDYNITIKNLPQADPVSEDIVMEDTIADGLEIVSVPEGCTVSGQKVSCTITPENFNNSGGEMSFAITVKVKDSFKGKQITNTTKMKLGKYDNCNFNREKLDDNGNKQCSSSVDVEVESPDDPSGGDTPVVPSDEGGSETVPNTGMETEAENFSSIILAAVIGVMSLASLLGTSYIMARR